MSNRFSDFINRNAVGLSGEMPLVHSTHAYYLRHIQTTGKITPQRCEVFRKDLTYFFFGRPAYKPATDGSNAAEWELPACFIMKYDSVPRSTRVYPFDTGAHHHRRMPSHIQMMPLQEFEAGSVADSPRRIVGAFYSDVRSYFKARPKDLNEFQKEFSPGVFDAEVKAIHRLALSDSSAKLDDRKQTVELQIEVELDLGVAKPIAVVAPLPYYEEESFRRHVQDIWGAEFISYPINSLSVEQYHGLIYERVEVLYKTLGLL